MTICWSEVRERWDTQAVRQLKQKSDDFFVTHDSTFAGRVFPGCGAVNFQRTAMEDLFKVDLQQRGMLV